MLWNPFFKTGFCRGKLKFFIICKSNPSTLLFPTMFTGWTYACWLISTISRDCRIHVTFISHSNNSILIIPNSIGICFFGATEKFCTPFLASFAAPTLPVRFDFCFLGTGKSSNFVSQLFCATFLWISLCFSLWFNIRSWSVFASLRSMTNASYKCLF